MNLSFFCAAAAFISWVPITFAQATGELPVFSISPVRYVEGASTIGKLNVYLSAASSTAVTVNWASSDGSATAGIDYAMGSGVLSFAPGETFKAVSVGLLTGGGLENDEECRVTLSSPVGATLGVASARLLIRDETTRGNLIPPSTNGTFPLSENPLAPSNPYYQLASVPTASVRVELQPGTATLEDFSPIPPTLTFSTTTTDLGFSAVNDDLEEGLETFRVLVSPLAPNLEVFGFGSTLVHAEPRGNVYPTVAIEGNLAAAGTRLGIWKKAGNVWSKVWSPMNWESLDCAVSGDVVFSNNYGTGVVAFRPDPAGGAWLSSPIVRDLPGRPYGLAASDDVLVVSDAESGRVEIYERHLGGADNWGRRQVLTGFSSLISTAIWGQTLAICSDLASIEIHKRNPDTGNWTLATTLSVPSSLRATGVYLNGNTLTVRTRPGIWYVTTASNPTGLTWEEMTTLGGAAGGLFNQCLVGRNRIVLVDDARNGSFLEFYRDGPWKSVIPRKGYWGLQQETHGEAQSSAMSDGWIVAANESPTGTQLQFYQIGLSEGAIYDDESLVFSTPSIQVVEPAVGSVNVTATVSIPQAWPAALSVFVAPVAGTAGSADFSASGQYVWFQPGETTKTYSFAVKADGVDDPGESFSLRLSSPSLGRVGPDAGVTITDYQTSPSARKYRWVRFAGTAGLAGGVNGPRLSATLNHPTQTVEDSEGNIVLLSSVDGSLRKIDTNGNVTTLQASLPVGTTRVGMCQDAEGSLYMTARFSHVVLKFTAGVESVYGGIPNTAGSLDGPLASSTFSFPLGIARTPTNYLYVLEGSRLRKISPSGIVETITIPANGGAYAVAAAPNEDVYITNRSGSNILKYSNGLTSVFAGKGTRGSSDGDATTAQFNYPSAICVDATGHIFVADTDNAIIRKITPDGVVTTIGGSTGSRGVTEGIGSAARFNTAYGIMATRAGRLLVADRTGSVLHEGTFGAPMCRISSLVASMGSATLSGFCNANASATELVCSYSTQADFLNSNTLPISLPTNNSSLEKAVTLQLPNLSAGAIYYAKLRASNEFGTYETFAGQFVTPETLSDWRLRHFGSTSDVDHAAQTADPDSDGLPNSLEWALGLSPNVVEGSPLSVKIEGANVVIEYTRSIAARLAGATYTVEQQATLTAATWETVSSIVTLSSNGLFERIKATFAIGTAKSRFAKLRITVPAGAL